ncbi:MAG: Nucleotidyltransferase [Myxococcales bacterium]|nr:Nucleotidyltransferase [Myxococcales bacterium]
MPVGSRVDGEVERPRAVSEYLVERMTLAGCDKICFVIGPHKSDIVEYYGARAGAADAFYVVQPSAAGLCDALFRAAPFVGDDEDVVIGLPDTVWFPEDGLARLGDDPLSFLLFPVARPELFDAVLTDEDGAVREIQVKQADAGSHWIWGAAKARGRVFRTLHALWCSRQRVDPYLGTLVNAYLAAGGRARGVRGGEAYVDVGTLHGYREAIELLARRAHEGPATVATVEPHGRLRAVQP